VNWGRWRRQLAGEVSGTSGRCRGESTTQTDLGSKGSGARARRQNDR
jgi:hypothetical protein